MGFSYPYRTAEVEASALFLVVFPAHHVVHDLGEGLLGVLAERGIEVVQRVALHALGQTAALPEGRHALVATHQLPLALLVLSLALGRTRVVVPLAGSAVFFLQGGRELVPLGLQLASAVGADLVVEPEYLCPIPFPRRATHSLLCVWQQTVDPVHHSPPLWTPVSLAPRP